MATPNPSGQRVMASAAPTKKTAATPAEAREFAVDWLLKHLLDRPHAKPGMRSLEVEGYRRRLKLGQNATPRTLIVLLEHASDAELEEFFLALQAAVQLVRDAHERNALQFPGSVERIVGRAVVLKALHAENEANVRSDCAEREALVDPDSLPAIGRCIGNLKKHIAQATVTLKTLVQREAELVQATMSDGRGA